MARRRALRDCVSERYSRFRSDSPDFVSLSFDESLRDGSRFGSKKRFALDRLSAPDSFTRTSAQSQAPHQQKQQQNNATSQRQLQTHLTIMTNSNQYEQLKDYTIC